MEARDSDHNGRLGLADYMTYLCIISDGILTDAAGLNEALSRPD